jgi:hypothetical protein
MGWGMLRRLDFVQGLDWSRKTRTGRLAWRAVCHRMWERPAMLLQQQQRTSSSIYFNACICANMVLCEQRQARS